MRLGVGASGDFQPRRIGPAGQVQFFLPVKQVEQVPADEPLAPAAQQSRLLLRSVLEVDQQLAQPLRAAEQIAADSLLVTGGPRESR